jgi:hypothetical protein
MKYNYTIYKYYISVIISTMKRYSLYQLCITAMRMNGGIAVFGGRSKAESTNRGVSSLLK